MEQRHHTLIKASDGVDVSLMGYFHANLRLETAIRERWWRKLWRILNLDISDIWRRWYGPKNARRN